MTTIAPVLRDADPVRKLVVVLITVAGLLALALIVALCTWYGLLVQAMALAVGGLAVALSFRWPLVSLFAVAALIPVEEVASFGEFGSISRLAGLAFALSYGVPRLGRLHLRAMPVAGWLFIAWAVASLAWAIDPALAWSELPTLIQLFAIAVLVADVVVVRPTVVGPLLWTYSIAAATTAVIGVAAYVGGTVAVTARVSAFQDQDVAQFAAILLPALIFSLFELLHGRHVLPALVVSLTTTTGIILSGTRGAWLAIAVVGILLILPQLKPGRRVAAVALVIGFILVSYQIPGVADLVARRTGDAVSSGGSGRTDIWSVALEIVEAHPVTGVGFENFTVAYTPERVREAGIVNFTDPDYAPHSIIVGTIGELGLIGFALLAAFILPLVLRRGWGQEAAAVQAMLAAVLISALFLDVLNRKQVWLVIGIAAGLIWLADRQTVQPPRTSGGRRWRPRLAAGASAQAPAPTTTVVVRPPIAVPEWP